MARLFSLFIVFVLSTGISLGQTTTAKPYVPQVGQDGKDVVWVPTPQVLVDKMLELAKATPRDYLMDLGSGDGRLVITAAKRSIRAEGIEYNPDMVALSQRNAEKEGVANLASFRKADIFVTDFSQATVITMFLLTDINIRLRPRLLQLKPGTRIVTNTFLMGEWQPDEVANLGKDNGCNGGWCTANLWIVPANVEGNHNLPDGQAVIQQQFQVLTGTVRRDGRSYPLTGKVNGEEFSFTAGGRTYKGRLNGRRIEIS